MKNVSIVICAFNEAKTISTVVQSCCTLCIESEVIVVDDGSTDNTEKVLSELQQKFLFKYEKLPENKGKSWSMARGVELSTYEIILFFDADISAISQKHFDDILKPIFEDKADMVLGQPSETLIDYRINPFKSLTGERALFKKDILPLLDDIREIRFGVETFINMYYQAKGKRIKYVLMTGMKHPTKYSKTTAIKATKEFIFEGQEIALTLVENYDLIAQRIELIIRRTNRKAMSKVSSIQNDVNYRIIWLKDKLKV